MKKGLKFICCLRNSEIVGLKAIKFKLNFESLPDTRKHKKINMDPNTLEFTQRVLVINLLRYFLAAGVFLFYSMLFSKINGLSKKSRASNQNKKIIIVKFFIR